MIMHGRGAVTAVSREILADVVLKQWGYEPVQPQQDRACVSNTYDVL